MKTITVNNEAFEVGRDGMFYALVDYVSDEGNDYPLRTKIDVQTDAAEIVSATLGALVLDRYALVDAFGDAEIERHEESLAGKLCSATPDDDIQDKRRAYQDVTGYPFGMHC